MEGWASAQDPSPGSSGCNVWALQGFDARRWRRQALTMLSVGDERLLDDKRTS